MKRTGLAHPCLAALGLGLLLAALIFAPYLVIDGGLFTYYGDYNAQQLAFYEHAHRILRSGGAMWDFGTDLGADFLVSYSFYLLGSPFFWLTLLFPTQAVPYLLCPLLMLKLALCAVTACLYLSSIVRDTQWAVIGGLCYAFSGFSVFNIFFNHFHEPMLVFPLLLLALDRAVLQGKRGWFGGMAAICLTVNYFFFFGQAVFLLLYFGIRALCDRSYRLSLPRFLALAAEALLGVGMGAFLLVPTCLGLMGNARIGACLSGFDLWLYTAEQKYPAILSSLFLIPDIPARPNLFPDAGAKWASLSAYIPLFSVCGTLAFVKAEPKHYLSRLLPICLLFALIPGLNASFSLFNSAYYARWFYMPVLLMIQAMLPAFEQLPDALLKRSFRFTLLVTAGICAAVAFTPSRGKDGAFELGLYRDTRQLLWTAGLLAAALGLLWFLLWFGKRQEGAPWYHGRTRLALICLCVFITAYGCSFVGLGRLQFAQKRESFIEASLHAEGMPSFPHDFFYRTDFYKCEDNQGMFWNLPAIQAFHSVVPPSISSFYTAVGQERGVASRPAPKDSALRDLLSVRYLVLPETEALPKGAEGFSLVQREKGFSIYERELFLPMGFAYESCISDETLQAVPEQQRTAAMLAALALSEDDCARYSHLFPHTNPPQSLSHTADRAAMSCSSFETGPAGFTAVISLDAPQMVFFSVPFSKGFRASVNGEETPVVRANIGFMAIPCTEGENQIVFTYRTPGLTAGLAVSVVSLVLFCVYVFSGIRKNKKDGRR